MSDERSGIEPEEAIKWGRAQEPREPADTEGHMPLKWKAIDDEPLPDEGTAKPAPEEPAEGGDAEGHGARAGWNPAENAETDVPDTEGQGARIGHYSDQPIEPDSRLRNPVLPEDTEGHERG